MLAFKAELRRAVKIQRPNRGSFGALPDRTHKVIFIEIT
jgi:hypothetical protein